MMDAAPSALQRAPDPQHVPSPRRDGSTYLTTTEVAALMRTSPATVRYWRHIGRGPAGFKVGRRVLYAQVDVEAWIRTLRGVA